jgi:hypothetical protein
MAERAFPAASVPSAGAGLITSPFQFWASGEDNLRVRVWDSAANQTLVVGVRAMGLDGSVQVTNETIVLSGTYIGQTRVIKLNAGAVLSVAAEVTSGFVQRGQVFVQIDLVRGFTGPLVTLGTLIQGYVGTFMGLAYPGSPIIGPFEGPWVCAAGAGCAGRAGRADRGARARRGDLPAARLSRDADDERRRRRARGAAVRAGVGRARCTGARRRFTCKRACKASSTCGSPASR